MIVDQAQEAEQSQQDNGQPCVDCEGTPARHLQGYAGGLYTQSTNEYEDGNDSPVGVLANWKAKDVDFNFTAVEEQTFSALFKLRVGMPGGDQGGLDINFGGSEYSFINANGFAALSPPGGLTIYRDGLVPADLVGGQFGGLASSGFFNGNNLAVSSFGPNESPNHGPPTIGPVDFCDTNCTFAEWGAFVAFASFEDTPDGGDPFVRNVSVLGWWIAGDIPPVGQLPFTGTATYAGDAIATVSTNLLYSYSENGWTTYVATGDLNMNWDFATRTGDLTISHFDSDNFNDGLGLRFSGPMCAPGVTACGTPAGNHFGGALSGQLPENLDLSAADRALEGFALGSFARGPKNIGQSIPQGVIGNWGVGNDRYMASGVFAGGLALR